MTCEIGEFRYQVCYTFTTWDYVVFGLLFVISAAIGMFFAYKSRNKSADTEDYLLGGRKLSAYPVALSMTASFMSAIAVLGLPAEFYIYGTMFWWFGFSYLLMGIIMSEMYIPIFYRLQITSTYEYLEMRFDKYTKMVATAVYLVNSTLYVGVVIYAPSLALNAVTGLGIWWSVALTAAVCIFYTTLGGMKAVVWTDVFQCFVMWAGLTAVIIRGTVLLGGFQNVWNLATEGGRVEFVNFDIDPKIRHTFWTISIGGTLYWTGIYGTTQTISQRYVSCKSESHAKLALYLNIVGLLIVLLLVGFAGLVMYAYYAGCDPYDQKWVGATDQLLPYFVLEILHDYPGVPGIFVCSAFSGTLSTVSSVTNAMSTVTVQDYIAPFKKLSPRTHLILSRIFVVVYGILCTLMAVITSRLGSVLEVAFAVNGIVAGAMVGLFTLGMLLPWCNSYGAISGLISGLSVTTWVYVGSTIYPPTAEMKQILPRCTDLCNSTASTSCSIEDTFTTLAPDLTTVEPPTGTIPGIASFYQVSYLYYNIIGFVTSVVVGMLVSFVSGFQDPSQLPPETIHRFFDHFIFHWIPSNVRRKLWCSVRHDQEEVPNMTTNDKNYNSSHYTYKQFENISNFDDAITKKPSYETQEDDLDVTRL